MKVSAANYIRQNRKAILLFLMIGAISMLLNLAIFNLTLDFAHSDYKIAAAISYIIATIFGFSANRYFNFAANNSLISSVWRYGVALCVNYFGTILIIAGASHYLGLGDRVGQFIGICIMTIVNFALSKHWIFKSDNRGVA